MASLTSRRNLVGGVSALAASVLASDASFVASVLPQGAGADASLLALREPWRVSVEAFRAALDVLSVAEDLDREHRSTAAYEDEAGNTVIEVSAEMMEAKDLEDETSDANRVLVWQIVETPAKTLAGLRFKVEVSEDEDHMLPELVCSIMEDIAALVLSQTELTRGNG